MGGNAGMFEKVIFRSILGHFVVDLWSICGQFVVNYRSKGIRYGTNWTPSTSAGEPLLPDDPSRDDEDATTEIGLLLGSNNQGDTIHKQMELLLWCNRVHDLFILAVIPTVSPRHIRSGASFKTHPPSLVYARHLTLASPEFPP